MSLYFVHDHHVAAEARLWSVRKKKSHRVPEEFHLKSHQCVTSMCVFDVKFDGQRRAGLLANDKVTVGH